jgi:RNA polymerase sigma-70 factor (ECF subfamily)
VRELDEQIAAVSAAADARPITPVEQVESQEAQGHLQQAFASLDEEQRLLLSLRDMENMSYEEIRQVTELPIGTVKSKLHRARLALHERFTSLQQGLRVAR